MNEHLLTEYLSSNDNEKILVAWLVSLAISSKIPNRMLYEKAVDSNDFGRLAFDAKSKLSDLDECNFFENITRNEDVFCNTIVSIKYFAEIIKHRDVTFQDEFYKGKPIFPLDIMKPFFEKNAIKRHYEEIPKTALRTFDEFKRYSTKVGRGLRVRIDSADDINFDYSESSGLDILSLINDRIVEKTTRDMFSYGLDVMKYFEYPYEPTYKEYLRYLDNRFSEIRILTAKPHEENAVLEQQMTRDVIFRRKKLPTVLVVKFETIKNLMIPRM